jgi:hypothetical protein
VSFAFARARCGLVATLVSGTGLAVETAAPSACAEVREAAERVAGAWRAVGASVVVDKTRFLNDDQTLAIALPDLPDGACTTVVLLGARGLGFHVSAGESHHEATPHLPSEAGVLAIERCHEAMARRVLVTSDSGRGALEVVVARSDEPLPAVQSVLPERTGGGLGPMPEPGSLSPQPPPEKRAAIVEGRARLDGRTVGARSTWQAGADGSGAGEETLQPGCHTLSLFAVDPRAARPSKQGRLDLDAEMRDGSDDRLLARDRSDAPDAQLPVCVGETTQADVAFVGSPPNAPVLVTHVAWPLPDHLPSVWGAEARARMARILSERRVVSLPSAPVQLAQGGSGLTPVPLALEPGGCYVALVALAQGTARALGLRVEVAARDYADDRGVEDAGAAVAFCAGDRATASAEVEAHGTALLAWGLALYRINAGVWEIAR